MSLRHSFFLDCAMSYVYTLLATAIVFHLVHGTEYGYVDFGMPVFILDADSVVQDLEHDRQPFMKVDSSAFAKIMNHCDKNSEVVVIFVERTLSVEDFSRKSAFGGSYPGLRRMIQSNKCKYYPSVYDPYEHLSRRFEMTNDNVFDVKNTSAYLRIYPNVLKRLYVHFRDDDEADSGQRASILLRHDRIISEVYEALRNMTSGRVVGFYTAVMPSVTEPVTLGKRQEPMVKSDGSFTVAAHDFGLFYLKHIDLINQGLKSYLRGPHIVLQSRWTVDALTVVFKLSQVDLTFHFSFGNDRWSLDEAKLSQGDVVKGRTAVYAGTDWGYSYACADPIFLGDGDISITLLGYQIQPFRPDDIPDMAKFAAAELCYVFVTAPIVMGMTVTFLLLTILFCGVAMMTDLRTYDRFDDPHGKPLVIGTQM